MSILFFDLDGTLVDSAPSILVSVRHTLTTMASKRRRTTNCAG